MSLPFRRKPWYERNDAFAAIMIILLSCAGFAWGDFLTAILSLGGHHG